MWPHNSISTHLNLCIVRKVIITLAHGYVCVRAWDNIRQLPLSMHNSHSPLVIIRHNERLHRLGLKPLFAAPCHVLDCQPIYPPVVKIGFRYHISTSTFFFLSSLGGQAEGSYKVPLGMNLKSNNPWAITVLSFLSMMRGRTE